MNEHSENTDTTDAHTVKKAVMDNNSPDQPSTLIGLLRHRAQTQFNKHAYTFLVDGEAEEASLTYGQLEMRARVIAARIQKVTARGDRALLLYSAGLEFVTAFFGCLYAGVIAVPTYPPRRNRPDPRFEAIAVDADASLLLTTDSILSDLEPRLAETPSLRDLHWLTTDDLAIETAANWRMPDIRGETLAFLQYTSGSTGTPKGVMVSHANLLSNARDTELKLVHTAGSIMVTWLPIFHDFGLMYGLIQPFYSGIPCYMMAPVAFLQKPVRWLQAISRYKATHSSGPNFAYELCVQRITPQQRAELDLSHWRVAINGAEPVRASTLKHFADAFEPCGFDPIAFSAAYGLAESTLRVSVSRRADALVFQKLQREALGQHRVVVGEDSEEDVVEGNPYQTAVGCGCGQADARIVIVHPETLRCCAPDEIGEIWVSSGSVAQGYWNRPEETEHTFRAHVADTGEGPFLRTGDLGFSRDDELFITGRVKDLIIIRGQNHYPQDIELTVEKSHESLAIGSGAAFSVEEDGEEQLVIVQEVQRTHLRKLDADAVTEAIRLKILEEHELAVYVVLLLRPGVLPKTSSGKVQRRICLAQFLAGELDNVGKWERPKLEEMAPPAITTPPPFGATKDSIRDRSIGKAT